MADEQWDSVDEDASAEENQKVDQSLGGELDNMFQEAEDDFGNITILVYGDAGTGKTHFSLTGDEPIFAIDTEGPLGKIQSKLDKSVKINEVQYYTDDNEIDGTESMEELLKIGKMLYQRSKAGKSMPGTVVVDSMSDVWYYGQRYMKEEVYREKGRDQTYQFDWTIANNAMRTLTKQLMNSDCDVVLTAQEQEKRDDSGEGTGEFKPKGWKKLPYQVDVIMRIQDTVDIDIDTEEETRVREGHVEKCRPNDDLVGTTIQDPTVKKLKEEMKNA